MTQETFTNLLESLYTTRYTITGRTNGLKTLQENEPKIENKDKYTFDEIREYQGFNKRVNEYQDELKKLYANEVELVNRIRAYVPEIFWNKKVVTNWKGRQYHTIVTSEIVEVHQSNNFHTI